MREWVSYSCNGVWGTKEDKWRESFSGIHLREDEGEACNPLRDATGFYSSYCSFCCWERVYFRFDPSRKDTIYLSSLLLRKIRLEDRKREGRERTVNSRERWGETDINQTWSGTGLEETLRYKNLSQCWNLRSGDEKILLGRMAGSTDLLIRMESHFKGWEGVERGRKALTLDPRNIGGRRKGSTQNMGNKFFMMIKFPSCSENSGLIPSLSISLSFFLFPLFSRM